MATDTTNVRLTKFCSYFCTVEDLLSGKKLKDLRKREIMSPFDLHINLDIMIELVNEA